MPPANLTTSTKIAAATAQSGEPTPHAHKGKGKATSAPANNVSGSAGPAGSAAPGSAPTGVGKFIFHILLYYSPLTVLISACFRL